MSRCATGLAALSTSAAAFLVLLLYAPAFQSPFLVPKFAALEVTAALGLVAFALRRAAGGGPRWPFGLTAGALLVLATTGVAWAAAAIGPLGAPYAVSAIARWGSLFGLACGASVLGESETGRRRVLEAITIGAATVAGIGLLQHIERLPLHIPFTSTPGSTFGNRNLAAEAIALSIPFGIAACLGARNAEQRGVMVFAVTLEALFLAVTRARGAWVAAACAATATLLLARARLTRTAIAAVLAIVAAAGAAAAVPGHFNPRDAGDTKRYSALLDVIEDGLDARSTALRTRVALWRRTAAMIADHPFFGVGPGNWPVAFPRYAEPGASRDGVLAATLVPRQAHEDWLERAAETGIPGLLALGVLIAGAVGAMRRQFAADTDRAAGGRAVPAAATGALVALGVLCFGSFPFEMPATLALAGLALGLLAGGEGPNGASSAASFNRVAGAARYAQYGFLAGALALTATSAVRAVRSLRGSCLLGAAERAMRAAEQPDERDAEALLRAALVAAPNEFRTHERLAQLLLREGRPHDSAIAATAGLALERYSPHGWAALAAAELAGGDASAARRDATRALDLLGDYPFALHLRAAAAIEQGDEAAASLDRDRLKALAAGGESDPTARAARGWLRANR